MEFITIVRAIRDTEQKRKEEEAGRISANIVIAGVQSSMFTHLNH